MIDAFMPRSHTTSLQRTALVTGAGSGIGLEIARSLAAAGARVGLAGRRLGVLTTAAESIRKETGGDVVAHTCDVTDAAHVEACVRSVETALGPIEVLVNAAGQAHSATLADTTDDEIDRILDVNVRGALRMVRAVVPGMVRAGFGRIINVASTAAARGYRFNALYVASKHALAGLTRSLSAEFLSSGVTVNAVCPGFTDTEIVTQAAAELARKTRRSPDAAKAALAGLNPLGRLLSTGEVASLVVWLAGDGAAGVSGQSLLMDGGTVPV